jgi:hypothetical protein
MNYFSKIVMIRYACGHKKLGIDTYQTFVTENKIKCPKCCKVSSKDTAEQIFRKWKKASGKFAIAAKLIGIEIQDMQEELVQDLNLSRSFLSKLYGMRSYE